MPPFLGRAGYFCLWRKTQERTDFINTLIIKTDGRCISLSGGGLPTSGSRNYDRCMFIFGDEWSGFTKSAVFWQDKNTRYEMLLDDSDCCDVPWEVQQQDGFMFVGAIGRKGDITLASKVLVVPVNEGTQSGNENTSEPTENTYLQLLARMEEAAESAKQSAESASSAADTAKNMPYINEQGNWMVYDSEAGEYQDSGISTLGTSGTMKKTVYDTDDDGIVDNAAALGGVPAGQFGTMTQVSSLISSALSSYATKDYVADQISASITTALEGSY